MKKTLSLILALLMSASCASYILADDAIVEEPVEETAVEEAVEETAAEETVADSKYGYAIEFLNHYGIYKGKSADDLAAEDDIERYQMALFVARISTGWVDDEKWEDGPENWSEFTDINEGPAASFLGALSYANGKGIIEGYGDGKFGPSDGITYQNALTMVVRTLGYQGLDWPWGYIQKAVSLGLTEGITDVAYTDVLTRGEVAQIIYNALFAKTKDGTTLAMQSFGVEFGWEQAVIVASDLDTFIKDSGEYKIDDASYGYYKGETVKPDDQYNDYSALVAFKLLNDDGTLGDDLYYGYAKDFGLSGEEHAHDDEAVVGHSYYVLFEKNTEEVKTQLAGVARLNAKNEKGGYVSIVDAISLLNEVVVNAGKTDDKGEAQEYAIQNFLKSYTLVTKYSNDSYVNVTAKTKPELLVFNKLGGLSEDYVSGHKFKIDWATGDILIPATDKDGNYLDADKKIVEKYDADKVAWVVKYYYSTLLEKYYEVELNKDGDIVYGINWITDAEMEKFLGDAAYAIVKTNKFNGFSEPITSIAKSAYATLTVFGYAAPERAIYESYRLGYFKNTNVWDGNCGKNQAAWNIADVSTFSLAKAAADGAKETDVETASLTVIPEGTADTHVSNTRAWFVEGYTPEVELDKDGEETGKYANGYVIYNYDAETGAIKVVKNVNDGTDADSYVATGVLRAYNLKTGDVTIGDKTFTVGNYNELLGNGMRYATKNYAYRNEFTEYFRELFNQYVEYVVVDGELVHVARKGATKSEVIVIDSYAGLSSDGYIVVNGYSTETLKYDQFRIGSYDNWMKGDYYYYLSDKKAAESFTKGAIYAISSYDADEDVYYVQLAGKFNDNVYTVVDKDYVNLDNKVSIESYDEQNYYMTYTSKIGTKDEKASTVKMKDTDKYIIIPGLTEERPYAQILVYEGKLGESWFVEGQRINSADRVYVIVNATVKGGFKDTYKTGLVLLLDDHYSVLDYNGAQAGDNWYLLGASVGEVEVFNLLNGKFEQTYVTLNKDLTEGHIYFTQDNVIVEDLGEYDVTNVVKSALNAYPEAYEEWIRLDNKSDKIIDVAEYVFGTLEVTKSTVDKFFGTKISDSEDYSKTRKEYLAETNNVGKGVDAGYEALSLDGKLNFSKYYDIISGIKVFGFDYEDDVVTEVKELTSAKKFREFFDIDEDTWTSYTFYANYAYDCDTGDIVYYISKVKTDYKKTVVTEDQWTNKVIIADRSEGKEDVEAYITASVNYDLYTTTEYGEVTAMWAVLKGVKLEYEGDTIVGNTAKGMAPATHANILANNWYFGFAGECTFEANIAELFVEALSDKEEATKVYYNHADGTLYADMMTLVEGTYDNHSDDEDSNDAIDPYCNLVKSIYVPFVTKSGDDIVIENSYSPARIGIRVNGAFKYSEILFDVWAKDIAAPEVARTDKYSVRTDFTADGKNFEANGKQKFDKDVYLALSDVQ